MSKSFEDKIAGLRALYFYFGVLFSLVYTVTEEFQASFPAKKMPKVNNRKTLKKGVKYVQS